MLLVVFEVTIFTIEKKNLRICFWEDILLLLRYIFFDHCHIEEGTWYYFCFRNKQSLTAKEQSHHSI